MMARQREREREREREKERERERERCINHISARRLACSPGRVDFLTVLTMTSGDKIDSDTMWNNSLIDYCSVTMITYYLTLRKIAI